MSLTYQEKIVHLPRYDGIFNSLCFNKSITWIFSCYQCGSDICMYCGKTVLRCDICCQFRCQTCAITHNRTICYLNNNK